MITEILRRTFWRNKGRSVSDVVKDSSYVYSDGFFGKYTLEIVKVRLNQKKIGTPAAQ